MPFIFVRFECSLNCFIGCFNMKCACGSNWKALKPHWRAQRYVRLIPLIRWKVHKKNTHIKIDINLLIVFHENKIHLLDFTTESISEWRVWRCGASRMKLTNWASKFNVWRARCDVLVQFKKVYLKMFYVNSGEFPFQTIR